MNKITNRKRGVRTTAIHAGEAIDPVSRASSPNLVMSSTFAPTEVAGFSARNRQGYEGFVYARLSSPTVKQLEDKLAALEEAQSCQCYASGMAASMNNAVTTSGERPATATLATWSARTASPVGLGETDSAWNSGAERSMRPTISATSCSSR